MKKSAFRYNKAFWILTGIFILSIVLRFIYLYQLRGSPPFGFYTTDSQYHDEFALRILKGEILFKDAVFLNPLYSFILAAIYAVFGHKITVVLLCQAALDSVTAVIIYFICVKAFANKKAGLLAAFLYACYGVSIFYTGFMLEATFSAFLLTASVLVILYADEYRKKRLWLLSGFILGLAALLRANTMLIVPFLAAWLYWRKVRSVRQATINLSLVVIGIGIALLPFSIRNYIIGKELSPFPVNGGINFYMGNHAGASGIYTSLEDISNYPIAQVKQSIQKARQAAGADITAQEASAYWFRKGVRFMVERPRQYSILMLKKLFIFWNAEEIEENEDFYFCRRFIPILNFPFFTFGILAPFALLGMIFFRRKDNERQNLISLFILASMASVILFFVTSRYRFSSVPLIIIMASYTIFEALSLIKEKGRRTLFLYLPILAAFFYFVNAGLHIGDRSNNLCINYNNVGTAYYKNGEFEKAITEYRRALSLNPFYAEAYNNLGASYRALKNDEIAVRFYERAIALRPDFVEACYGLANIYIDRAEPEKAIRLYEKILEADPLSAEAFNNLGILYAKTGNPDMAITFFKKALLVNPDYGLARDNLAVAYRQKGD